MAGRSPLWIDRDRLHVYLWHKYDPIRHRMTATTDQLAAAMGMTRPNYLRTVKKMASEGRLVQVGGPRKWRVVDPEIWRWLNKNPPCPVRIDTDICSSRKIFLSSLMNQSRNERSSTRNRSVDFVADP